MTHRLRPASVLFSDYYFYLIAFKIENDIQKPYYFRVDRISRIMKHRTKFDKNITFDEGGLRNRSLFIQPGKLRKWHNNMIKNKSVKEREKRWIKTNKEILRQ